MEEIRKVAIDEDGYPEILKEIANPPKVLYYRGNINPKENCFGIVGTRQSSLYGRQVASQIAGEIADSGITVVSGLAPGIDSFAHFSVIQKGKRTIAVLGTGLDDKSIYPKENIGLARKILEAGGCLISEYPPGTSGSRSSFPQRNRIISGLSKGVLVVEAKRESGSLITANFTISQKRKLFAIPGSIYSDNSKGVHDLIKKGAKLIDSVEDILKDIT